MSFLLRALLQRYMSEGLKMTSIAVWEQPWIRGWYWGWCECNTPSSYPLSFADGPKAPYKSQQKILLYKFTLIVRAISGLEPGTSRSWVGAFTRSAILIKVTCLVTLFDRKLQIFSSKWTIFVNFYELLSTQNVNVARFARNVEYLEIISLTHLLV